MSKQKVVSIEDWRTLREKASDHPPLFTAIPDFIPYSGLKPYTIAHLRKDWIDWNDDHVRLRIPQEAPCNNWKHTSGSRSGLPPLEPRKEPCQACRENGDRDCFQRFWMYDGDYQLESRTIILNREIAAPAVKWLEYIFETYNRPEVPWTFNGVHHAFQTLNEEAGIDATVKELIRTGIIIYAKYGIEIDEIARLTPYNKQKVKQTIRRYRGIDHPEVQDVHKTTRVIEAVAELGPVGLPTLVDHMGVDKKELHNRLSSLRMKSGRVKKVQKGGLNKKGGGSQVSVWDITVPEDGILDCRHPECDFTGFNITSVSQHESRSHPDYDPANSDPDSESV